MCVNGVALAPGEAERLEARLRHAATPILGGFGPMPSAAVARLHGDPEDPVPAIGDGMLLEKLDDWAIDSFLRVAGPGSPLLAAEIRHLGGALAAPPPGAGARGHLEGRFLLFGVGIPGAPAPAAELDAHLDRYLHAMRPWATGTRFLSFAERTSSLRTCVPDSVLSRLRRIRAVRRPRRPAGGLPPAPRAQSPVRGVAALAPRRGVRGAAREPGGAARLRQRGGGGPLRLRLPRRPRLGQRVAQRRARLGQPPAGPRTR